MDNEKLKSVIESALFISGEPTKIARLAKLTETSKPEIENAIMALSAEYESQGRGIRIIKKDSQVQMTTAPENATHIQQLIEGELQESLSPAAVEVLSVIAYRGPVTRSDIEFVRGVNCSYTLRNLMMRGLIDRNDNPKDASGYIYGISFDFLKKMGIEDIKKLPDYETLSKDERINNIISNQ